MMRWTPERLAEAHRVRGDSKTLPVAAAKLSAAWGTPVTGKALERAFAKEWDDVLRDASWRKPKPSNDELGRILILGDIHAPYEDRDAWSLVMQVARHLKPTHIVQLGDLVDMYSVSAHSKDPKRLVRLEDEVAAANRLLDDLDSLGAAHKHITLGNHEHRLQRYLEEKAPELTAFVSVEEMLRFEARGWHVTAYRDYLKIGAVHYTHEIGGAGAMAHVKAQAAFEGNVVMGHVHRLGVQYAGNAKGESHVGIAAGWLGRSADADYMHRVVANRSWQTGFCVGYMEPDGVTHIQAVPIVAGSCVVGGRLFRAAVA